MPRSRLPVPVIRSNLELENVFDKTFLSVLYRAVIDIDTDNLGGMVCQKIIDGAGRATDVKHIALGQGFGRKSSRTVSIVRALRSRFSASYTYGLFSEKLYWYPLLKMVAPKMSCCSCLEKF